jgi:hypothetical protein
VPGELFLGGVGVGNGYWNRAELTAEKFLPNPFRTGGNERIYRTGDLARYRPDGNLELLGRVDFQVKIRGFRIELGEIENQLRQHPAVRECVVMARQDEGREKRLVAYLIAAPPHANAEHCVASVRRDLEAVLPEYMVPSAFVVLDGFPLSPNGKVNRRALPAPDTNRPALGSKYVAPSSDVQHVLADIWSEILGLDAVGANDAFIALGGSSLLATRVALRVGDIFGCDILATDILACTIAELEARLHQQRASRGIDAVEIARVYREICTLSDEEVQTLLNEESVTS